MEKEILLKELKQAFEKSKQELKFNAMFEELEELFFLEDMALSDKFISPRFPRQMINRMVDGIYSWAGLLHPWTMPPAYDMIYSNENKQISEEERKEIMQMIADIMYIVRKNKRIAFEENNKEDEGKFIDEILKFEKEKFVPFLIKFHKKFEDFWEKTDLQDVPKGQ
jgi:hypothetical protein